MSAFWFIFFVFATAVGFFLTIISAIFIYRRRANIYLSLLVLSWSLILVQSILYWQGILYSYPHFTRLYLYLQFLIAPLPFLYLRALEPQIQKRSADFWHLLPFFLTAFSFLPYFLQAKEGIISTLQSGEDRELTQLLLKSLNLVLPFYLIKVWLMLWNWRTQIDVFRMRWYKAFAGLFSVYVIFYFFYEFFNNRPFFSDLWDYFTMVFLTFALLGLAVLSHLFPYLLHDHRQKKIVFGEKYSTSNVTPGLAKETAGKIESILMEDRLYRQNISLAQFAAILNISKNQLSQIVNQEFGCSFPELINQYRIIDAQNQMQVEKDKSIKEIYYDVGFSNKTTFYTHFKKITGQTPTEFRQHMSD